MKMSAEKTYKGRIVEGVQRRSQNWGDLERGLKESIDRKEESTSLKDE